MTDKTTTGSDAVDLDKLAQDAGFILNPIDQLVVPAPNCDARPHLIKFAALIAQARAAAPVECKWCEGTGRVNSDPEDAAQEDECERCKGSGRAAAPALAAQHGLNADEMARLRRMMRAVQVDESKWDDEQCRDAMCTVFAMAAGQLERAASQPAPVIGTSTAPEVVSAIVRDVCELTYVGNIFDDEKMLAVSIDDLRLICERNIASLGASTATAEPATADFRNVIQRAANIAHAYCRPELYKDLMALLAAPAPQQAPLTDAIPKLDENEALRKLAFRTLWLAYVWNDHNFDAAHREARATCEALGIGSFDEANAWIESINNRASAASAVTATTEWSQEPPTEQGEYWHWNGDEDTAPYVYHILWSGTAKKCFVSIGQYGITEASFCDEFGGWWKKIDQPAIPDRAAMAATKEKNQ